MTRVSDIKQEYRTDGDRLRLIAEAIQDDSLTDYSCRLVINSLLFPSRVDDRTIEWAQSEIKRLEEKGLLGERPS